MKICSARIGTPSKSIFVVCFLAFALAGGAALPVAAAPASGLVPNLGRSAETVLIDIKNRRRGPSVRPPPIAPSYLYYDYPYYYARGHYPTHIRPGFIYFGVPYSYNSRSSDREYGDRCSKRYRSCVAGWSRRLPRRPKAR